MGITVAVVVIALLLGAAAIMMPAKSKILSVDVETKGNKVKYVTNKRKGKKDKKASFLDGESSAY